MKLATLIILSSIALVSVSLIVPSYIATASFTSEFEKTVISDITILTSNAMDKINRMMNERIIDVQLLTSKSNLNLVGNHNSINEKMDYLRDYEINTQVYTSISIYDLNGIKIGDTRNLKIGIDESDESFFIEAIQGKTYHDSIPVQSKSLGVPIIHFSGPLYDDNGNINGVLTLRFSLSKINDILNEDIIYSKPMEVHLISDEGMLIYSNHPHKGILKEPITFTVMQNFLKSTDNSISFFETSDEGVDSLLTAVKQKEFQQYGGDNWVLIFNIPSAILFEEIDNTVFSFITFAGIILVIAVIASFFVATKISNPIIALKKEMQKVSSFNYNINPVTARITEIELMSNSFQKMVNDIQNAQKQIQDQLEELKKIDEQKDEFAAMVSHELKTPLTPIRLYTEMLLNEKTFGKLNDNQFKALRSIYNNINSLEELVDDVLDATKLELGRLKLSKKEIELDNFMWQNTESFNSYANEKKIDLLYELRTSGKIFCDPKRITQVLSNLVKNSTKFSLENTGKIKIIVEKNTNFHVFTVEDNGIGIPKKNQASPYPKILNRNFLFLTNQFLAFPH